MTDKLTGLRLRVRGIVQGVGFRPFVYSLATRNRLTGWVRNTSSGVEIEVYGFSDQINSFVIQLNQNPPPLARIDTLDSETVLAVQSSSFLILDSSASPDDFIPVSPDMTICADCQRELSDPNNRRYRYPFINCTNCGPRFSIVRDIPYDRPLTTMAEFPMCEACKAEYHNPLDRRFHAQPVACPQCGPQVWLEVNRSRVAAGEDAINLTREWLKNGKIIAIKGIGGFHLACDATNADAVDELRRRKKRSDKPFALMAFDLDHIRRHCSLTEEEGRLLTSPQHPVVLMHRLSYSKIARSTAPQQNTLGFMLPYTPIHLLLLEPEDGFPDALIMTSGNISEEPIAFQDEDAQERLEPLADAILTHNRGIHMRVDDSVARIYHGKPYLLRRSRGYAPDPIRFPFDIPPILAAGAELKNSFCLTRQDYAFLSHYIGDMENFETLQSFEEGIEHFKRLFRIHPSAVAVDLHPDYLSTRHASNLAEQNQLPLYRVQHHHAHLAACLADNQWESGEPVIGVCFDGTGLGTDGSIWGSEFLVGGYHGYQRMAHLKYVPLPGGDQTVRKVSRMALAHLRAAHIDWSLDLPAVDSLCAEERTALAAQIEHGLNTPLTSSMGRLFDAVSALIGVQQNATYEGQAAIELEAIADPAETYAYPFEIEHNQINPSPMWQELIQDFHTEVPVGKISARFHNGVARMTLEVCRHIRTNLGIDIVALSGGVWQNMLLLNGTQQFLEKDNFKVLVHHRVPANDGCISLGQAVLVGLLLK